MCIYTLSYDRNNSVRAYSSIVRVHSIAGYSGIRICDRIPERTLKLKYTLSEYFTTKLVLKDLYMMNEN